MNKAKNNFIFLVISLTMLMSQSAYSENICKPAGYVIGFFNGVWNTKLQAEGGLSAIRDSLLGETYNGETLEYELFYNQTGSDREGVTMLEDVAEVFQQRAQELDGALSDRWEIFWETLGSTSDDASFFDKITSKISNTSTEFKNLIGALYTDITTKSVAGWSYILSNPPTSVDYTDQHTRVKELALEKKKLVLIAHSQGNLFVNQAYDAALIITDSSSVKVVHIAPASSTLRGNHVLANLDLVINGLRVQGLSSIPDINVTLPAIHLIYDDFSGHKLVETYLNNKRDTLAKVNGELTSALDQLNELLSVPCNKPDPTVPISMDDPTPTSVDRFGVAVSISGNTALVGAPSHDSDQLYNVGEAFLINVETGKVIRRIENPEPMNIPYMRTSYFGSDVAIDGNNALVAYEHYYEHMVTAGRVYLYSASSGALLETFDDPTQNFSPRGTLYTDHFGGSVAIHGNRVLIGETTNTQNLRKVHLFSTGGALLRTFHDPTPGNGDFGEAIAINGELVLIGEPRDRRAHLFNATTGELIKTFKNPPSSPSTSGNFGVSVALNASKVLIGDSRANRDGNGIGAAHLFDALTGEYLRTFVNKSNSDNGWRRFGNSVAINEKQVLIGETSRANDASYEITLKLEAYLFNIADGSLIQSFSSPTEYGLNFGSSVALSESHMIIGEAGNNYYYGLPWDSGQVHLYQLPPPTAMKDEVPWELW